MNVLRRCFSLCAALLKASPAQLYPELLQHAVDIDEPVTMLHLMVPSTGAATRIPTAPPTVSATTWFACRKHVSSSPAHVTQSEYCASMAPRSCTAATWLVDRRSPVSPRYTSVTMSQPSPCLSPASVCLHFLLC